MHIVLSFSSLLFDTQFSIIHIKDDLVLNLKASVGHNVEEVGDTVVHDFKSRIASSLEDIHRHSTPHCSNKVHLNRKVQKMFVRY